MLSLATYIDAEASAFCQQEVSNWELPKCQELLIKVSNYQNQYNQSILDMAKEFSAKYPDIDLSVLSVMYKRVVMNESQFVPGWITGSENGTGLAQITPDTLRTLAGQGLVTIPQGYSDDASLISLMQDPDFNIQAGMANLIYLHQGIVRKNASNGWVMSDDEVWRLTAAFYNSGPQSLAAHAVPDPTGHDFWEESRLIIQNDPSWYETYGCNDPAKWDCLKFLFPNKDTEGYCTILYAESVAPNGISNNPTLSDILNTSIYNRQECLPNE